MIDVRRYGAEDRLWARTLLTERWGEPRIVSRGRLVHADGLPGFVAWEDADRCGLITYQVQRGACELVTLDSTLPGFGVGTRLVDAVRAEAERTDCGLIWVTTTNDNLEALRFYQRRGFVLRALHRNALDEARKLKPSLPRVGKDGIPLRDEIELEIVL